jgi:hypothetical protein
VKIKIEKNTRSWEDLFGVDDPDYLPYWVAYMPKDERLDYLKDAGKEFLDYKNEMLHKNFDWKSWESKVPEHAIVKALKIPKHIKEI